MAFWRSRSTPEFRLWRRCIAISFDFCYFGLDHSRVSLQFGLFTLRDSTVNNVYLQIIIVYRHYFTRPILLSSRTICCMTQKITKENCVRFGRSHRIGYRVDSLRRGEPARSDRPSLQNLRGYHKSTVNFRLGCGEMKSRTRNSAPKEIKRKNQSACHYLQKFILFLLHFSWENQNKFRNKIASCSFRFVCFFLRQWIQLEKLNNWTMNFPRVRIRLCTFPHNANNLY